MADLVDGDDIDRLVRRVAGWRPADLAERCAEKSGLGADDFRHPAETFDGRICAVDGSNTTLLRTGSAHWVTARAGASIISGGEPAGQKISPLRVVQVGVNRESPEFGDLFRECFGEPPSSPLRGEDYLQGGSVVRDTIEYWVVREMLGGLEAGDLLCIDGALRVSHAAHLPVMDAIITEAAKRGCGLVGVAKQTSATWDGGYPLIPAISALALREGVRPPWYVKIPQEFLDQRVHEEWRRGETYVARFHPRSYMAFKIEVPAGAGEVAVSRACAACAACAGDGRFPGYPFPLLDAHRLVTITAATADDLRGRIIAGLGAAGIDHAAFNEIFGDIHDVFARY